LLPAVFLTLKSIKPMALNWTEPKPPIKDVCFYDHVTCDTPLGECWITWKSWKEHADFDVAIGDVTVGYAYSLEEAKAVALKYLSDKAHELSVFIGSSHGG
jgi:hypothetical protein